MLHAHSFLTYQQKIAQTLTSIRGSSRTDYHVLQCENYVFSGKNY